MSVQIFLIVVCAIALLYVAYKIGRSAGKEAARKSAIFQPGEGYWQELSTLVVWKCARNGIHVTDKDMARYEKEFRAEGGAVLITGGEPKRLTFEVISRAHAQAIQGTKEN